MSVPAIESGVVAEAFASAAEEAGAIGVRTLASATEPLDPSVDPSAVAFGSRRADDRWFCWEQADRDRFAIAGLGAAHEIVSRGADRFADVAADWAHLLRDRVAVEPASLPAGAGPLLIGGFSFAPDGGQAPAWSSFAPALMILPEVALWRRGGDAYITVSAVVGPDRTAAVALERILGRLGSLRDPSLPLVDPAPATTGIEGGHPPGRYERIVAEATGRISAGEVEKVVLAREVLVTGASAHDPGALYGALRELFPSCFCFCAGTPEAAFVGASPELLVRRSGAVAATVALAGSSRRSADPAVNDHLGEQMLRSAKVREEHAIVVRRIERSLRDHAVWVQAEDDPAVAQVANIQHLATPIRAQLAEPRSAVELAGILHPTPAVGGEPRERAMAMIEELEEMDRGWYAGAIGWMDAAEDGEFCVALRSGLLRDRSAHLYAGAGIVADSDPADELAETEVKLEALLPLLTSA